MGFVMDGLGAEDYDRNYSDRALLQRILSYFRPHFGIMLLVAVMVVLNSLMDAVLPIIISRGIDILAADMQMRTIILLVVAILLSGAFSWTFNFVRQWFTARAVGDVVLTLRQDAFEAVMARDMSFYDSIPSGKIVSRVTSDTQDFATVVTLTLNLLSQILLVFIIVGVLLSINVRLTLIALAISPVVVVVALSFRRIARETTLRAQRALARVNATVQETISGISVAKSFRQEAMIYHEFDDINKQSYHVNLRQGFVFSSIFPVLTMVGGIGTAVVVYFGGLNTVDGTVSVGDWYLFIQAVNIFWFPLTSIASFWSQFQQGLSASERVFALIDADPQVQQTDNQPVPPLRGEIRYENLDFRYTEQEQVLQNFNLTIKGGETVALVGHTGAGKSSLGKLVARFYEFKGGRLLIDGHDIRSFDLVDYRRQLGVVPQLPFLFSGTVGDNVRYAKPKAGEAEILAVARQIGWGEWLDALPEGLDTPIREGGRGLSMGQRQLVALARVMLQDPAILILDEATASVDPVTEAQIQESLALVLQNRTAIVIAHRLSTIQNADRIIVLRQGEIIEEGDHPTLIARGGHYAELYDTYFRHQALDYVPPALATTPSAD